MLGCGVVGSEVARLIVANQSDLTARSGAKLELVKIGVRNLTRTNIAKELLTTDLESIVKDNLVVMEDPEIGQDEKGLFSGNYGFEIGDFICTYGGQVKRGDKIGKKQSRFLMQLGTTYLIDGQDSNSFGRFINHGCSTSANARTQFIVTQSSVYLGVVALKKIKPNEQIFMEYCGVVPKRKINPTITGVILNCKCLSCISGSVSRRTNTKVRTHTNLSKVHLRNGDRQVDALIWVF
jgi:hypothetical protein